MHERAVRERTAERPTGRHVADDQRRALARSRSQGLIGNRAVLDLLEGAHARDAGRPLPPDVVATLRSDLGIDVNEVRIHDTRGAADAAAALDARAFTWGNDIAFAQGEYDTETPAGRGLLAHELTHVAEQRATGRSLQLADTAEAAVAAAEAPSLTEWRVADDPAMLGRNLEPLEVRQWRADLEAQGYKVYTRQQFKGTWLEKVFPDARARPDLVAVRVGPKPSVLVGDVTAGPWSTTAIKPGDPRKLPIDLEGETKPHLQKTVENARQVARNLGNAPKELQNAEVVAQDRYWQQGGRSKPVTVRAAGAGPAATTRGGATARTGAGSGAAQDVAPEALPKGKTGTAKGGGGGRGSGTGGAVVGLGINVGQMIIHQKAVEKITENEGYAPVGPLAYAHEDFLSRLGRFFTGATIEMQEDLRTRFSVVPWRASVRKRAEAAAVGEMLPVVYQLAVPKMWGQDVQDHLVLYRKLEDGSWEIMPTGTKVPKFDTRTVLKAPTAPRISGTTGRWDPPDLNFILGEATDEDVELLLLPPAPAAPTRYSPEEDALLSPGEYWQRYGA